MNRYSIILLNLLLSFALSAQEKTDLTLQFRDVHTTSVEHVLPHPDGKFFFSADAFGKILMWSTENYKVIRTIQVANGARITAMRWINNGKTLVTTSGSQGKYIPYGERMSYTYNTDYDRMTFYYPFSLDSSSSFLSSTDMLGTEFDPVLLVGIEGDGQKQILGLTKELSVEMIFQINADNIISKAAITSDKNLLAFTEFENSYESDYKDVYTLKLLNITTKEILSTKVYRDEKVVGLVFNPTFTTLHILVFNREKRMLRIEEMNLESTKFKTYKEIEMTDAPDRLSIQRLDQELIVLMAGMYSGEHILHFQNDKLEVMNTGLSVRTNRSPIDAMTFIPHSDHIVIWNSINSYFGNNPEFIAWNHQAQTQLQSYFEPSRTQTKGVFLPDNNWMVFGSEVSTESFNMLAPLNPYFKYYEKGTFNNRFSRLKFTDYLVEKYGIHFASEHVNYALDESTGKMVFPAFLSDRGNTLGPYIYMVYDLINDELDTSNSAKVDFMIPIDYVADKNRFLVKDFQSGNQYKVIENQKIHDFNGNYMKADLSKSGDYLLLVDAEGIVKVHSFDKNKIVFQSKYPDMSGYKEYSLGSGDPDQFWLSFTTTDSVTSLLKYMTILLNCEEETVKETRMDNFKISGISVGGEEAAILLDGVGVVFGKDRLIPFDVFNFPYSISLNKSGNRLMASLRDGTVQIYDIKSLRLLGTMNHPDSYSHVMIDTNAYFASNTRTDAFLLAKAGDKLVDLNGFSNQYNRPDEILKIFGEPNESYISLLKKSAEIHQKRTSFSKPKTSQLPEILSLSFNGLTNFSTTSKEDVQLELEFIDYSSDLKEIEVEINNIPIKTQEIVVSKGILGVAKLDVKLFEGENVLSVRIINKLGISSTFVQRSLFYQSDNKKGDLYVLSIGISDYPGTENDLTFASKDANDIALLYGESSTDDLTKYQNEFLGERYTVKLQEGQLNEEIRHYVGGYSSSSALTQADQSGRFWLEVINYSEVYLWDFKESNRKKLEIKSIGHSILDEWLYVDPTDKGFCYQDENQKFFYYSFQTGEIVQIEKPEEYNVLYLGKDQWLRIKTSNDTDNSIVKLEVVSGKNEITPTEISFQIEDESNFELLATVPDFSKILVKTYYDIYLISQVKGKNVVEKLNWKESEVGSSFAFTADAKQVNCVTTVYASSSIGGTSGHWFISYDFESQKFDSVFYEDPDFSKLGFNNIGGVLKWVEAAEPIAIEEAFMTNESEKRASLKPVSFEKVHIKKLINENATHAAIFQAMDEFLKSASPQDELIVFFAGHGILDSMLQFHFASYDMDFNHPETKGIPYDSILHKMGRIPVSRKLLLLDACHSGDIFSPVGSGGDGLLASDKNGRGGKVTGKGTGKDKISDVYDILFGANTDNFGITVIAASSGADLALESQSISNGAFTSAYLESILSNFRGVFGITIDESLVVPIPLTEKILYSIRKKVIHDTEGRQIPNVRSLNKTSKVVLW